MLTHATQPKSTFCAEYWYRMGDDRDFFTLL
jgi:hypothetical protein